MAVYRQVKRRFKIILRVNYFSNHDTAERMVLVWL